MRDGIVNPPGYGRGRGSNFRPLVPRTQGPNRVQHIVEGQEATVGDVVVAALEVGLGILLSPTRDAGAVGIILYDGDGGSQTYASTPEEFLAAMDAITARVVGKKGPKSKAPLEAP